MSRSKKTGHTQLEIFRALEKNVPVDSVEIKETVKNFFWEPSGSRFCILTTEESGHNLKAQFYNVSKTDTVKVASYDLLAGISHVYWAPAGQYFVMAAIPGGDLIFGGLMPDNKLEILHRDEHFMLTNVEWDPSSRYVITAVTQPMRDELGGFKYQMEAGYAIWTFQGRQLYKLQKEKLFHISWRPHPPSMLEEDQQRHIRKNIKQFSKKYDALDEQAKESARKAFREDREERTNAFLEILNRIRDQDEAIKADNGWQEALDEMLEGTNWEMSPETLEEELDAVEELIQ